MPEDEPEEKQKKEKGQTQRLSFELLKQGKTVEEIASECSLTVSTIGGHLARFVSSGELDIEKLITEDKLELIKSYFEKAESASLSEALAKLGNQVSYWEMRMVVNYLSRSESDIQSKYIL